MTDCEACSPKQGSAEDSDSKGLTADPTLRGGSTTIDSEGEPRRQEPCWVADENFFMVGGTLCTLFFWERAEGTT